MEYLSVSDAKNLSGLRLVLSRDVPGPWGEAAKALFKLRNIEYKPVAQKPAGRNPELVEWTRHRNAPIALFENEAPRVRWQEVLDLAERLGTGPSLVPVDRAERIFMMGLINEIAGEGGLAWNARFFMLNVAYQAMGAEAAARNPMLAEYQFDLASIPPMKEKIESLLAYLSEHIKTCESGYLVGSQFTAADVYWAYFSNMLEPLPHVQCPMPDSLRVAWGALAASIDGYDTVLIEHRDMIFAKHLTLPMEF
jgi:glutathione S-transferase